MTSLWFGDNLRIEQEIAPQFDDVPMQSSNLSSRTLNPLLRHNFKMTIGDILRADEKEIITIEGLGKAGLEELQEKVSQLIAAIKNENNGLSSSPASQLATTSKQTHKILPESVENLSLNQLHLETETNKALMKAGINTIGSLYYASSSIIRNILGPVSTFPWRRE